MFTSPEIVDRLLHQKRDASAVCLFSRLIGRRHKRKHSVPLCRLIQFPQPVIIHHKHDVIRIFFLIFLRNCKKTGSRRILSYFPFNCQADHIFPHTNLSPSAFSSRLFSFIIRKRPGILREDLFYIVDPSGNLLRRRLTG